MERRALAGMSPARRGTTVWQLSQRQIWWEARWPSGSQPVLAQPGDDRSGRAARHAISSTGAS